MGVREVNPVLVLGELGLVSSLGGNEIPLIVGSEIKGNPVLHSRYAEERIIFSAYDTDKFIDELCELGRSFEGKAVIFSDDDRAILNISNHRERLKDNYIFLYPTVEMVKSLLDKQDFIELCETYRLPAPTSYKLNCPEQFECIASQIKYPCIVKPSQRHYWWGKDFIEKVGFYKKAIKCSDYEQFKTIYQKIASINPSVVIQEYVEGEDRHHYSANLFVDEGGNIRGYYIAQKLRIYPIKAGTGSFVVTLKNQEVLNISKGIIDKLQLKGLVNIQFKQDCRSGEYKLMEIHARNSQWSLLGKKAGANLAYLYYRYLVHGTVEETVVEARPDVKYINLLQDYRAYKQYRAEGKITFWQWVKSLKGETVFAVYSFSDPMPIVIQFWQYLLSKAKPRHQIDTPEVKRATVNLEQEYTGIRE